jgi:hypothetical protein
MPSDFSVVAIVSAFNEADVIGPVIGDLIAQGLQVYVLDDGSTDDTVAFVEPLVGHGVIAVERLPPRPDGRFDWERILLRKTALARELDADWFLHHDADEFRESPWPPLTLKDAIQSVDALGYNAIDFWSLDFWPIDDRFRAGDDVRMAITGFMEGAPYDRLQIRCWKKTGTPVDLVSSGGHEAQFAGRNVFPLRFILRHYPIRGQAHGERKVFEQRRNRLRADERARGWHVQYDDVREGESLLRDPSTLTAYDPNAVRIALALRHRGAEALEATQAGARADLEAARAEMAARDAEIVRTRIAWEDKAAEASALHHELGKWHARMAAQEADIARLTADAEGLAHTVDELTASIAAIRQSLSWRCTAPLRALSLVLRGRR